MIHKFKSIFTGSNFYIRNGEIIRDTDLINKLDLLEDSCWRDTWGDGYWLKDIRTIDEESSCWKSLGVTE